MNCDRIARWYRWMEYASFGRALHGRRCHFLATIRAQKVLLLGDGDGRFLAELAGLYPELAIDYIDSSRQMLALASARTAGSARVRFFQQDVLAAPLPDANYDLIVTHFFLDCFTPAELAALVEKISAVAAPEACWIVSEFHQPERGWRRLRARLWIHSLYRAFRLLTGLRAERLPIYASALRSWGFVRKEQVFASAGLLTSELWQR